MLFEEVGRAWAEGCVVFLVRRYEESMGRKKVLEDELNDMEGKLLRAEKLVTGTKRVAVSWS